MIRSQYAALLFSAILGIASATSSSLEVYGTVGPAAYDVLPIESSSSPPPSAVVKNCTVANFSFGEPHKYLIGAPFSFASIYATCEDGKARCFKDMGETDRFNAREFQCDRYEEFQFTNPPSTDLSSKPRYWPEGIVCYSFNEFGMARERRNRIERAMEEYHKHANVTFIKIGDCYKNYGTDTPICNGCHANMGIMSAAQRCSSSIGMDDAPTKYLSIDVGDGSDFDFIYMHLIGHSLGLYHTHSHPNRSVIALKEHMIADVQNYAIVRGDDIDYPEYDPSSVMHYHGDVFCIPKDPSIHFCDVNELPELNDCVEPKEEHCDRSQQSKIGGSDKLQPSDVANLQKIYGKPV